MSRKKKKVDPIDFSKTTISLNKIEIMKNPNGNYDILDIEPHEYEDVKKFLEGWIPKDKKNMLISETANDTDLLTGSTIYSYYKEYLGMSRITFQRERQAIKRKEKKFIDHPQFIKNGKWFMSKKKFFEHYKIDKP